MDFRLAELDPSTTSGLFTAMWSWPSEGVSPVVPYKMFFNLGNRRSGFPNSGTSQPQDGSSSPLNFWEAQSSNLARSVNSKPAPSFSSNCASQLSE